MATEILEKIVGQQPAMKKCSAWFCENLVDISNLGTEKFLGYEDPSWGGIYCCENHYDESIDR